MALKKIQAKIQDSASKILNIVARGAGSESKNPELDWILGYFSGKNRPDRFDDFGLSNKHRLRTDPGARYFDHPESTRTRVRVCVEWVAFAEIAQDMDMIYIPCGISSGLRAHEEVVFKNKNLDPGKTPYRTTYKVEGHIGTDVHRDRVIGPNRDDNLSRAQIIGDMHPDQMIIAPVMREAAVRQQTNPRFSANHSYEEEDYMAFWNPAIDRCKGMGLDGDPNYSRNSIWETMRGVLIQSGYLPWRRKADMDVFDLEGRPVTLYARAEKIADTLKYQLGKGFEPREAATALARIFTIDDKILDGTLPPERLHDVLKKGSRSDKELADMKKLKEEFKPLLLGHCAQYLRLDDLPKEYVNAAKARPKVGKARPKELTPEQREAFTKFADGISENSDKILSVLPSPELSARLAEIESLPQRPFDSHERFFEKRSLAKMFEDDIFHNKLLEWERLALPFVIGATETALYPAANPMATMICTDLKRGKEGFRRGQDRKHPVHNMNEIAGALGSKIDDVIRINAREAEALKKRLKEENRGKIIVNTLSFLRIADAMEYGRKFGPYRFVAADDKTLETSPQMRLALQMKYLDRNVDRAVFQEGWEYSNDLVQLRVRARLIQAGLVERPAGAQSPLHVFSVANLEKPETLLDDIKLLTKEVKRCVQANAPEPEQAIALARLVALHELVVNHTLRDNGGKTARDLVNHLTANVSVICYDRKEAKVVTDEARALLTGKAALWMPEGRLYAKSDEKDDADRKAAKNAQDLRMKDYVEAGKPQKGKKWGAMTRPPHDEIQERRRGAGGAGRGSP